MKSHKLFFWSLTHPILKQSPVPQTILFLPPYTITLSRYSVLLLYTITLYLYSFPLLYTITLYRHSLPLLCTTTPNRHLIPSLHTTVSHLSVPILGAPVK